jgi:hypothetical protein
MPTSSAVALVRTHVAVAAALTSLVGLAARGTEPPARAHPATLDRAEPFRLEVSATGRVQKLRVYGTGFENAGHPDRDEYMHWQIRRAGGAWQPCAKWHRTPAGTCRTTGWAFDEELLEIGGDYVARGGAVELRVFTGLADTRETDPHKSSTYTEWSNVLRIPVVVPGAPPTIISLSNATFPTGGRPEDYRFSMNVSGVEPSLVVVFRGDVVVAPERIQGSQVHLSVPEVYRRDTPGELSLTVRTDRGGESKPSYIRFFERSVQRLPGSGVRGERPVVRGPTTHAPGVGTTIVGVARDSVPTTMIRPPAAMCLPGFVWRGATPQDFTCVTPEARDLASRQNAAAAGRRADASGTCVPGYVWRDAVARDVVCVTPAERAAAAEDNRIAPSRTAAAGR